MTLSTATEFPHDPQLIAAVEAVYQRVSISPVQFANTPRAWREATKDRKKPSSPNNKANKRKALASRDGAKCAYCASPFGDLDTATLDHVIPNEIVKTWGNWNLVLACDPCNNAKKNKIPVMVVPLLSSLLHQLAGLNAVKREAKEARLREKREADRQARLAKYGEQMALDLGSLGGAR